jgi:hypothetical protein
MVFWKLFSRNKHDPSSSHSFWLLQCLFNEPSRTFMSLCIQFTICPNQYVL